MTDSYGNRGLALNAKTAEFVRQHADEDVRQLALRGCSDDGVNLPLALQQIQGRQTARRKLPSWAALEGMVYPPHLSMEQCSSEPTARYKAQLARRLVGHIEGSTSLLDLTGGMGVDFAFMSAAFTQATYVERNAELAAIAAANFQLLGLEAKTVCADGISYFLQHGAGTTMVFLDPARRDEHGGRTYGIADCTPDVLQTKDKLLSQSRYVVLKLSPMLDWRKAVNDLGRSCVAEVHIVSTGGECKELLLVLTRDVGAEPTLCCANDEQTFVVPLFPAVPTGMPPTAAPAIGDYLYEPNASLMKAGCFAELAARFGLRPIAANSHLFVASTPVDSFPGRRFKVSALSTLNKHDVRQKLAGLQQANVSVRNFPLSVAELRRRLKLGEGGSNYLFATTLAQGNRVLIVCQRA